MPDFKFLLFAGVIDAIYVNACDIEAIHCTNAIDILGVRYVGREVERVEGCHIRIVVLCGEDGRVWGLWIVEWFYLRVQEEWARGRGRGLRGRGSKIKESYGDSGMSQTSY